MQTWINKMALSRIGKTGKGIFVGTDFARRHLLDHVAVPVVQMGAVFVHLDDQTEQTLWPDHFPYSQALIHWTRCRLQSPAGVPERRHSGHGCAFLPR